MDITLEEGAFDAIIFDCDGTLIDTAPSHFHALNVALREHDREMPPSWYFLRVGLAPTPLMDEFERDFGPLPVSREALLEVYSATYKAKMHTLEEVAMVAVLARDWKGRVPMAVASNGVREIVRQSLESVGLLALFDTVVTIDDVEHGKPAPDVFLEAARRIGVSANRCVVLEDSDEGLQAAKAAGMAAIDVREHWTPEWKLALR